MNLVQETGTGKEIGLKWERILVPVDFTPAAIAAIKYAGHLAAHDGGSLCLLYVVEWVSEGQDENLFYSTEEMGCQAEHKLARLAQMMVPPTVPQRVLVQRGRAVHQIIETAELVQSDLIVLAVHRRPFWQRFLARSISQQIVAKAPCNVLLLQTRYARHLEPTYWDMLGNLGQPEAVASHP
jgi:nucleotide-binding universal stress UspA family protein